MTSEQQTAATFPVDPERLASGAWCPKAENTLGQGDINASYSAERIGMGQPIRKPFEWRGALWVCVSITRRMGETEAEAYRKHSMNPSGAGRVKELILDV